MFGFKGIFKVADSSPPLALMLTGEAFSAKFGNVYKMDEYEMKEKGIDCLSENLYEAVKELTKDEVIKDVLGEHTYQKLKIAAIKEWREYSTYISKWELDNYLRKF